MARSQPCSPGATNGNQAGSTALPRAHYSLFATHEPHRLARSIVVLAVFILARPTAIGLEHEQPERR